VGCRVGILGRKVSSQFLFGSLNDACFEMAHYRDTSFDLDHRHCALGYHSPHQFD
jgi:putative transposase